jgi:hypothetical protein
MKTKFFQNRVSKIAVASANGSRNEKKLRQSMARAMKKPTPK